MHRRGAAQADQRYANDIRRSLRGIWTELIRISNIGVHDIDFFDLGGRLSLLHRTGTGTRRWVCRWVCGLFLGAPRSDS